MNGPVEAFEQLLVEADQAGELPLGLRTAEIIGRDRRFRELGKDLLRFHRGYQNEHEQLLKLVSSLHECYRETSPGFWVVRVGWAEERQRRHKMLIDYIRSQYA